MSRRTGVQKEALSRLKRRFRNMADIMVIV